MSRISVLAATACLGLLGASRGYAAPSCQSPEAPLDLHNLAKSEEILKIAKPLLEKAATTIPALAEHGQKAGGEQLREQFRALRLVERLAFELQMQGETAGVDYRLRVVELQAQLAVAVGKFRETKAGIIQAAKDRQLLASSAASRTALFKRIDQLIQQQKLSEAYTLVTNIADKLWEYTMFLTIDEVQQALREIGERARDLTTSWNRAYRGQVLATLDAAAAEQLPKLSGFAGEVSSAVTALRSAPTATVGGQALTGPQCLTQFGNQWRQAQLAELRCRAIEWARRTVIRDYEYLPVAQQPSRVVDKDWATLCADLIKALPALIEADAARASAPEAATLHAAYLQAAAPLVAACGDDGLEAAFTAALNKLAAKSPDFAAEVAAYRAATSECLRWRERVAKSAVVARQQGFTASTPLLLETLRTKEQGTSMLGRGDNPLLTCSLPASCPTSLRGAAANLVGQKVLLKNAVGLPPGGKACVTRYEQRHYGTIPWTAADQQIAALQKDLLVTEQAPPLTLEATVAILSAQQGHSVTVAGAIKDVYLEGLIPRFAKLPESAAPLVRLGPLPSEPPDASLLNHVLIRLNVTPAWVSHRYFFIDLGSTTPPGT